MKRRTIVLATAVAAVLTAAVAQQRTFLTVATGGTGGVYYIYGGGLASLLGKWMPGVEATAEATAAAVDNMKLLDARRADLVFTLADVTFEAYKGQGKFTKPVDTRALAVLYNSYVQIVALDGSGVNSLADLKGKRVSTGAAGSGTEVIALRILEAAGVPLNTIKQDRLGVAESAAALKDRKIDAFFWLSGLPASAVQDLANTPNLKLKLLPSGQLVSKLRKQYGAIYTAQPIPKDVYKTPADVSAVSVGNLIAVRRDMTSDMAYRITKAMMENRADLAAIHPEAKKLEPVSASRNAPVPLHAGAVRYYKEVGAIK